MCAMSRSIRLRQPLWVLKELDKRIKRIPALIVPENPFQFIPIFGRPGLNGSQGSITMNGDWDSQGSINIRTIAMEQDTACRGLVVAL